MPKFIDHHVMPPMSAKEFDALITQTRADILSKKPDKFGVTWLNGFMAGREAWGYTEAPNAEAVIKSHAASGIKLERKDIKEVTPIV